MDVKREIENFLAACRAVGDAERAAGQKAYLKSELEFCGVRAAELRSIANGWVESIDHWGSPSLLIRHLLPAGETVY